MNGQFLGWATAYGYAKTKGYEGTEEEFAELMASYASVAQDAATSAATATANAAAAAASQAAAEEAERQARAMIGAPLMARRLEDMTDHDRIYVYTGEETGMVFGMWYMWYAGAWAGGGMYNSTAFVSDTTLSISGAAADAKVTGDYVKGMAPYNANDVLMSAFPQEDATVSGTTFTFSGRTCSIAGGSGAKVLHLIQKGAIPAGVVPGSYVYAKIQSNNDKARFRITFLDEDQAATTTTYITANTEDAVQVPVGTVYWSVTIYCTSTWSSTDTATMVFDYILTAKTNKMLEEESNLAPNLAPVFDAATDYSAGDYVRNNGQLYRFTLDHPAGDWSGTDAASVTIGGEFETVHAYGAVNLLEGLYKHPNVTSNGIKYLWDDGKYIVWGTATAFSVQSVMSLSQLPSGIKTGDTLYLHYKTSNPGVRLRVNLRDNEEAHFTYYTNDSAIIIPAGTVQIGVGLTVENGTNVGTEENPTIVSDVRLMLAKSNLDLSQRYNSHEPEKPLYVAIGGSTTLGAVHYYTESQNNVSRITRYQYPEYVGEVMGLEVVNLSIGGVGLIQRTSYNLKNHMDNIYTNDEVLSKAALVTIGVAAGNDLNTPAAPIGVYDDYYPYDAEGYHPPGYAGCSEMIALGATICGALNWCIKWIGDHYPKAQVIVVYGRFSDNFRRSAVLDDSADPPKKLIFSDNEGIWGKNLHAEVLKIVDALNIPLIDYYKGDGLPYTYYGAQAKDDNGDYVIFSTIKSNGEKVRDVHPNDDGYKVWEKFLAGRISQHFYR